MFKASPVLLGPSHAFGPVLPGSFAPPSESPRRISDTPSREILVVRDEGWIWKLALAIGAVVLAALMIFNAYERYQTRKDIEAIAKVLEIEAEKAEADFERQLRAITVHTCTACPKAIRSPEPPPCTAKNR